MPYCYYTCNLIPPDLLVRCGYSPRWLGDYLRDPAAPPRRDALSVHPMTCPYVTKLVAAADALLGGAAAGLPAAPEDCVVVPGGCDAMRRLGDLLAAAYPGRVFVLSMPRSAEPEVARTLAADLGRLEHWLQGRLAGSSGGAQPDRPDETGGGARGSGSPSVDYPKTPQPGGVFLVAGPLSDDSLLELVGRLGAPVAALESCTSPDRWKPLAALDGSSEAQDLAAAMLEAGVCPRCSTMARREYLMRRLDETRPSSIIYARQSFCDPGAYDALLVAALAEERSLPYLEIEVDFPFDATGPLHTRVEAFLEAQLLDDDLLLDDDFVDDTLGED